MRSVGMKRPAQHRRGLCRLWGLCEGGGLFVGGEDEVGAGGEGGGEGGGGAGEDVGGVGEGGFGAGEVDGLLVGAEVYAYDGAAAVEVALEDVDVGVGCGVACHGCALGAGGEFGTGVLEGVECAVEACVGVFGPVGGFVFFEEFEGTVHAYFLAGVDEGHAGEGV